MVQSLPLSSLTPSIDVGGMSTSSPSTPVIAATSLFCDFLEAAIHTVLSVHAIHTNARRTKREGGGGALAHGLTRL